MAVILLMTKNSCFLTMTAVFMLCMYNNSSLCFFSLILSDIVWEDGFIVLTERQKWNTC